MAVREKLQSKEPDLYAKDFLKTRRKIEQMHQSSRVWRWKLTVVE